MQLKITTDYAIRSLVYLAMMHECMSSHRISESMGIPQKYLIKILRELKAAGWVDSVCGGTGGYQIIKDPQSIRLLDVIQRMEGTVKINRCLEHDKYCSRFATENCPVRNCYTQMQHQIEDMLANITIAQLADESR